MDDAIDHDAATMRWPIRSDIERVLIDTRTPYQRSKLLESE